MASDLAAVPRAPAPSCQSGPPQYSVIKLGIDVDLGRYVVVRQRDGGARQPLQRFSPSLLLEWDQKQTALAEQVYNCYEAGSFGYGLHRNLKDWDITNYVVRPGDWDEYGKKGKAVKRDAEEMVLHVQPDRPHVGAVLPPSWVSAAFVRSPYVPGRRSALLDRQGLSHQRGGWAVGHQPANR